MSYWQVDVVIDGALDRARRFGGPDADAEVSRLLDELRRDWERDGRTWTAEIYTLWHEHDADDTECACVQYVTDHRPAFYLRGEVS